jgi:CTP synthase
VDELTVDEFKFVGKDEKGERMQILEFESESICDPYKCQKLVNKHRTLDHPFFLGFQAHPEFCTRPLYPSPPILGFVAAASGEDNLQEQFEFQATHYRPPHTRSSMISEAAMKNTSVQKVQDESEVHMNVVQVVNEDM